MEGNLPRVTLLIICEVKKLHTTVLIPEFEPITYAMLPLRAREKQDKNKTC